jgi:hypothetical protein
MPDHVHMCIAIPPRHPLRRPNSSSHPLCGGCLTGW